MTSARRLAFSATERGVDRVHGAAADVRPLTHPPAATGFADRHILVIEIAHLTDSGVALDVDLANLAGRHLDRRVFAFLRDELNRRTRAAGDLPAFADLQLHVVDLRAERDVLERQRIPRQDVDAGSGDDRVSHLQPERLQAVALLAVRVGHQRNARRTVRVVLDSRDLRRNVSLVALEVDDAVHPLVTAAAPP